MKRKPLTPGWSIRELKYQISTSLYKRLLLSEGKTNKETVLALAEKGIEMAMPLDMIKDPYVFEFLGVPENKPVLESDLEKALVAQIEKFLLESGRGFRFEPVLPLWDSNIILKLAERIFILIIPIL